MYIEDIGGGRQWELGPADGEGDGRQALHRVAAYHKLREKRQRCRMPGAVGPASGLPSQAAAGWGPWARSTPEALPLGRGRPGWSQSLSWAFPRAQGREVTLGGSVPPRLKKPRQQVAKGGPGAGVAGAEPFPVGSAGDQAWGRAWGRAPPTPSSPATVAAWEPAQGLPERQSSWPLLSPAVQRAGLLM